MHIRLLSVACFLFLVVLSAASQISLPLGQNDLLLQGYRQKISGSDITYDSSLPGINEAMIVRAITGKHFMEWETEPVPASFDRDYATFIWLAGMGCNLGEVRMELEVNGQARLPVYVDTRKSWTVEGPSKVELHYRHNMFDGVGDQYGFMFLRVPKKMLKPGQPLRLKVTGGRFNSQAWYMTFKSSLKAGLEFKAYPALSGKEKKMQVVGANIYHFDQPVNAGLYADGELLRELELQFGFNYISFGRPAVDAPQQIRFRLEAGSFSQEQTVTLKPVRQWQVHFVQHSHTDIGYTRPQTEILAEHLRYIDYALDYCDATDHYPDDARFRWTCEASWAVDEYLKSRPKEQIERLKERVREGRIEVTGMYFNFDELPDEQTLAASLAPIKRFEEHGINVKLAMQNDVNGTGWCFNDYFNPLGVKYLNMGTHGHKALICFDIPTSFWWESPSGNRMLAFRAEHYMTGNTAFGIHAKDFHYFEGKFLAYLDDLDRKGYPHDIIAIQHSGHLTDNSPPSTLSCDIIKMWNEKYDYPKLRSAVAREFFEEIERAHGDELPVFRVAWPDWWTDGFGSAAREVAATREAHTDIIANQGALSMARLLGAPLPDGVADRIAEVNKAILFYGEHTLGSSESIRDPYGKATMEQREMKESFAWEANRRARMVGEEAMGILQNFFSKEEFPSILVFNTLNWERNGLIELYIDHQILPPGKKFRIVDREGAEAPAQKLGSRSDGAYWAVWVENVPDFGVKKYFIHVEDEDMAPPRETHAGMVTEMENQWYRLTVDPAKGALTGMYDKQLGLNLVDPQSKWALGEFINEQLGDRAQLEGRTLVDYKRIGLDTIWYDGFEEGPVWNTIRFKGEQQTFFSPNGFEVEIRLFHTAKRIDLTYEIVKKPIIAPEGIYLAFPFRLEGGKVYCEVPGGLMEAGVDQLPGSSNDWNTIQNFASVKNEAAQIVFGSHEVPLVQFGGINTGRFLAGAAPQSAHIFSWPMNNYWTTNFNADQRGGHEWSYYITSSADASNRFATQFGWGARVPMPARVLPPGVKKEEIPAGSFLQGIPDNVLLVSARPDEDGESIILHLRELDGRPARLNISGLDGKALSLIKVNVVGKPVRESGDPDAIGPLESAFFRVF